jgi:hypothetical protein
MQNEVYYVKAQQRLSSSIALENPLIYREQCNMNSSLSISGITKVYCSSY